MPSYESDWVWQLLEIALDTSPVNHARSARSALRAEVGSRLARKQAPSELELVRARELFTDAVHALLIDARGYVKDAGGEVTSREIAYALKGFCKKHPWVPWPFC